MERSDLQEQLSRLYLRLNGYFVTNLIIHSAVQGNSNSELDIVAVRFPYHDQQDRNVATSQYLEVSPDRIEIMLADVKGGNDLMFNDGLLSAESVEKVLKWIGVFTIAEINTYTPQVLAQLKAISLNPKNEFRIIDADLKSGACRIKITIFGFGRPAPGKKDMKYIYEEEILSYCWNCLKTAEIVESCSRKYNFRNWGEFERLIRYFKSRKGKPKSMDELYKLFITIA